MTENYPGELEDLRKLQSIVRHTVLAEKLSGVYFICGHTGSLDRNGLPDNILVCPAYGADWAQVYQKTERTT